MSPLDLGPELDIILGWDWLSSHDLHFLYPQGSVSGAGPQGSPLSAPLRPTAPAPVQASVLIGHGEFRRMLRRVVQDGPDSDPPDGARAGAARLHTPPPGHHGGMSKPLDPLGTAELAAADSHRQRLRARRRAGLAPPPRLALGSWGAAELRRPEKLPDDGSGPSHLRPEPALRAYDGCQRDCNIGRPHAARRRGTSPPGGVREQESHGSRAS